MSIYARLDREINAVVFNGTPYGSVIVDNRVILAPLFNFEISADGESCTVSPGRDHYEGELEIPATYANLPIRLLSGFESKDLTKVTALSGSAFTSDYCFSECTDLQEIYGITGAGKYAFQNCYNLYKIGATMYHLSEGSFYGCTALSEITILGNGIGVIPFNCFYGCDNLTTVYFLGTEYEWNGILIQEGNEALTNAEIIFHEHTYSDWEITKNPGCGTEGEEERTCSGCGAKEIHTIAASDHDWGEWDITLEPTCTANGEKKCYCPQCDMYDTENTPALGHDLGEPYTTIEPTCEEDGKKRQECQREGCDYYETSSINKKGHKLGDWYTAKEVTDTENGQKRRDCQREGCDYHETADIVSPSKLFAFDRLPDGTYSIRAKVDLTGDIVIPSSYKGVDVTQIKVDGFEKQTQIRSVVIPDTITIIGEDAFYGCSTLEGIVIGSGLSRCDAYSFLGCSNIKFIYYKGMEEDWSKIKFGVLANPYTNIFSTKLYYYSENKPTTTGNYWYEKDGFVYEWGIDYDSLVFVPLEDGTYGVAYNGSSSTVVIPHQYCGKIVSKILDSAFEGFSFIKKVELPDTISDIGERAFAYMGNVSYYTEITIPNSVIRLGDECFAESAFFQVKFNQTESKLVEIPRGCFRGCKRLGFTSESGVYKHGRISIPNSVTCIGESAFNNSEIVGVTFGEESQLERIDDRAFFHCYYLENISIPEGCLYIGNRVFDTCHSMTECSLPASLVRLGYQVFAACNEGLRITVGEGNATYKYEGGCLIEIREDGTEEVSYGNQNSTIPSSASSIGSGAFYGQAFTAPIKIPLNITHIESKAFGGLPVTVHVEATRKPKEWADDWCDDSVTVIWGYDEEIEYNGNLKFEWINNSVYQVSAANKDISGDIYIPSRHNGKLVSDIAWDGFSECHNITSVTIAEGISLIGGSAFADCTKLKKVIISDTVKSILEYAFARCNNLEYFVLGMGVELIGEYALPNDLSRDYIYFSGSIDHWYSDERHMTIEGGNGLIASRLYFYSEHMPTKKGNYWHYVDGEIVVWDVIEDDGSCSHTYGGWTITVTPTCTRLGRMERRCSACGYVEIEMIPVLKHIYEEAIIEPTCTEKGYATYTCIRCKHSYTETISALDHDWDKGFVRIEPTCTANGVRRHTCTRCGVTIDTGISALRHDWGEWRDVHPAECEIEGTRESTCNRCGERETRVIPAAGHDWDTEVEVVEPTCTKGGYTIHTCNACGATRKDNFTGALGHNYVGGICTRCNNDKRGVVYYGVSAIPERYNSSFVLGLEHKAPADAHLNSISVMPLEGEYIYYCAPTSFGDCIFSYNNFVGGFTLIVEGLALTNEGGKTEAYNIYKSNQANLGVNGAITITIKEMG